jgi:hypothetical protein
METIELPKILQQLIASLETDFETITKAMQTIKEKLQEHADGKKLKGDELTGWLGEVYGKMLMNGTLVTDQYDYDFKAKNMRISVKARKGTARGWETTSLMPKIEGDKCPTHLMFIQFTNDYSIYRVWFFPWNDLYSHKRFIEKKVSGKHRGYYVRIKPLLDKDYLIYEKRH